MVVKVKPLMCCAQALFLAKAPQHRQLLSYFCCVFATKCFLNTMKRRGFGTDV